MKKLLLPCVLVVTSFVTCAESEVPAGYTRIPYVEATGTQYVDTGFVPNANTRIEAVFQVTQYKAPDGVTDAASVYVFGCYGGGSSGRCQFKYGSPAFMGWGVYYINGSDEHNYPLVKYPQNFATHTIVVDKGSFYLDGSMKADYSVEWDGTSTSLALFASNGNGTIPATTYSHLRLHSFSADDGVNKRDFVPVVRDSDGVAGLYDLAAGPSDKKFYPSSREGYPLLRDNDRVVYVSKTGSDDYPYDTPAKAATDFKAAADQFAGLSPVIVLPGTYDTEGTWALPAGLEMRGEGALGEVVFTSSVKSDGVLILNDAGNVVSNIAVRGGVAKTGSTADTSPSASGVWVKAGLLSGCEISGCSILEERYSQAGAVAQALVLNGSGRVMGCVITNNVGAYGKDVTGYARGSAVYVGNDCVLESCEIAYNVGNVGGLTLEQKGGDISHPRAIGCDIHHNVAYNLAGGVLMGSNSELRNCTIRSNKIDATTNPTGMGGGVRGPWTNIRIVNCLICDNEAPRGGGLHLAEHVDVVHCTIVGNRASVAGSAIRYEPSDWYEFSLVNSIVRDNQQDFGDIVFADIGGSYAVTIVSCCLETKPTLPAKAYYHPFEGGIYVDPLFADSGAGDFRLTAKSPCIDVGQKAESISWKTTSPVGNIVDPDLDGQPRALVGKVENLGWEPLPDMGCYERGLNAGAPVYVSKTGSDEYPYDTPAKAARDFKAAATEFAGRSPLVFLPGTYDTEGTWTLPEGTFVYGGGAQGDVILTSSVDCDGVLVLNDSNNFVSNIAVRGGVAKTGSTAQGSPSASGVWVKAGLLSGCEISGCSILESRYTGAGAAAQALVVGGSGRATGCVITNNVGSYGKTVTDYARGSAVFLDVGGTIENSEIAYNTGTVGGVTMVNKSSSKVRVIGCDIHHNRAYTTGGGILTGLLGEVRNCKIWANVSDNSGGGIRNPWNGNRIVNCLIFDNEAGTSGGGLHIDDDIVDVVHCTVVGNRAKDDGAAIMVNQSPANSNATYLANSIVLGAVRPAPRNKKNLLTAVNCCFDSELTGDGVACTDCIFGESPKFVNAAAGDYHLRKRSPCRDAGLPVAELKWKTGWEKTNLVDPEMEGHPRALVSKEENVGLDPIPDMGCYEHEIVLTKPGLLLLFR